MRTFQPTLARITVVAALLLATFAVVPVVLGQGNVGPTATPDAEGVIYAVVQEGDSFWSIAARHGLTLEEIYELNDASEGDFVQVGQKLIVGYGDATTPDGAEPTSAAEPAEGEGEETATATPEPETEATATPVPPTETPTARGGEICLSAYLDENRNGERDAGEALKAAVAFTISNGEAVVSNYVTDGRSEPYCITGLDQNDYRVTRSTAKGEVLTTPGEWAVSLAGETSKSVEFGSYIDEEAALSAQGDSEALNDVEESAEVPAPEEEGGITRVILIAAVVVSVLLLVGVLVVVLSVRRSTI